MVFLKMGITIPSIHSYSCSIIKLTQMKLAEMADIDRSHISAIELGNVGVSFDVIFKLCEVLEITPKQLFDFREW